MKAIEIDKIMEDKKCSIGWKGQFTVRKVLRGFTAFIIFVVFCITSTTSAITGISGLGNDLAPHMNKGARWRIGYCESQPYFEFDGTLYYIIKGLEELGWVSNTEGFQYTPFQQDTRSMWKWLSENDMGQYIEFVEDAYYDMSEQPDMGEKVIKRLNEKKDIDLMIVNGTYAAINIANDKHKVPTLVFSTSNAVQSEIIESPTDSGLQHVWAHVDPKRFNRQVEIFNDIFKFKKMGLVYENSYRKVFAAVDDVEEVGREREFGIEHYYVDGPIGDDDYDRYINDVLKAHKVLADKVDAMYITNGAWEFSDLPRLLKPFYDKKIPVFSQAGSIEVRNGALMSIARADFSGIGRFGADKIARIFNGSSPGELPQIFEDTPNIAINMEVADKIGYRPTFDILLVADEIYTAIENNK